MEARQKLAHWRRRVSARLILKVRAKKRNKVLQERREFRPQQTAVIMPTYAAGLIKKGGAPAFLSDLSRIVKSYGTDQSDLETITF